MSFFKVENLTAGYGGKQVVNHLSFELEAGSLTGLLGANGSGKSTLLKALCGILPHRGSCMLEKQFLEELSSRELARLCSYIPQRSGISIDISVLDVVLMGFNPRLGLLEYPSAQMKEKARQALARAGLAGREEENYLHLSEGQKQLCILARTLAAESRLLLLDEPESALDFRYRYRMLELLREWIRDGEQEQYGQRATLAALHDPSLALNCCDRLLLLEGGEIRSVLRPFADPLEKMEEQLALIYGCVSLYRCMDKSGREQLVMLKENGGWE